MNDVIETGRSEMPLLEEMAFTVIDENSMHYFSCNIKTKKDRSERNAHDGEHLSTYEMCKTCENYNSRARSNRGNIIHGSLSTLVKRSSASSTLF